MDDRQDKSACPDCVRWQQRVAELERQVESLTAQVEKLTKLLDDQTRAGKRQASPFSKGKSATPPKKPGRKSGEDYGQQTNRAVPTHIDEVYDAPLPCRCPCCDGHNLQRDTVEQQYQVELPTRPVVRQFNIPVGHCVDCGTRVQGRHELQTSDALGAAAVQLGPHVHALITIANKELGLSHGKVKTLLKAFGIEISRSTSCRSMQRTAKLCEPVHQQIREQVRGSPFIVGDETGWRINGESAWLHVFVGEDATCYVVDSTRSDQPLAQLIGREWNGTLVHDGWSVYDRFEMATHQQCVAHALRRAHELAQRLLTSAARFPLAITNLFQRSLAARDQFRQGTIKHSQLTDMADQFEGELNELCLVPWRHPDNIRFAAHLFRHSLEWFTFLHNPRIDATNWRGEQAIRPAVVNRKVWGGNRTVQGAHAQSILTSVLRTCHQQAIDALNFLAQIRQGRSPTLFTP